MDKTLEELEEILERDWKEKLLEQVHKAGVFGKQEVVIEWDNHNMVFRLTEKL